MFCFVLWCSCFLFFFFFKQKTAYEMRISDWSSDVCSSDLILAVDKGVGPPLRPFHVPNDAVHHLRIEIGFWMMGGKVVVGPYLCITFPAFGVIEVLFELGRASCRERVCQYV